MTAAAILGAVIAFRAELLSARADEDWSKSVRIEALRDGYFAYEASYVLNLAPSEVSLTIAQNLHDRFAEAASQARGETRSALLQAAKGQRELMAAIADPSLVVWTDRRQLDVELSAIEGVGWAPTPAALQRSGDAYSARSDDTIELLAPIAIAFLLGTISFAWQKGRRLFFASGLAVLIGSGLTWILLEGLAA